MRGEPGGPQGPPVRLRPELAGHAMALFQTVVFGVSRMAAALACLLLAGMVAMILYEIVLRAVFSTSTFVLSEFVGYAVSACTFLTLGYALEHGSLVRVNAFLSLLKGGWLRAAEFLCASVTLVLVSAMVWFFWLRVARHWTRGTTSSSIAEVPLWIPEGAVLVALGVFWLQLFAYALRQLTGTPPPVTPTGPSTD